MNLLYKFLYNYYLYKRYRSLEKELFLKPISVDMGGHVVMFYTNCLKTKPILFVHGFLDASFGFRRLANLLKDKYSIWLVDVPGFGKSKIPPVKYMYQIDIFSKLLYQAIQKLNLEGLTVVGHSMGGLISQNLCLLDKNHNKISKLILLSSANSPHPQRDQMRSVLFPKNLEEMDRLLGYLYYKETPEPSSLSKKIFTKYWNSIEYTYLAENTIEKEDTIFIGKKAAEISLDTLILCGEKDSITTVDMMKEIAEYIPNSRLKIIPLAGHAIHLEKPNEVASLIDTFMQTGK